MEINKISDYRQFLKEHFELRTIRNPSYSLRAFARDLGLSPSTLSEVLHAKQGLSRRLAVEICERLGIQGVEKEFFCELVDSEHARSQTQKQVALQRLNKLRAEYQFRDLTLDRFDFVAEWHHMALLELMETKGFRPDWDWIAKRLNITLDEAQKSFQRLIRMGLIDQDTQGKWRPNDVFTDTGSDVSSEALRNFHKTIVNKALQAQEEQTLDEREFQTAVMAVSRAQLPELKKAVRAFVRQFCAENYSGVEQKDSVYALSLQFFELTQDEGGQA